ncbi:hypothetical protein [Rathayibacter tanaceti]|nr:hypothetical protein [Rathayibacter tanaceti]
MNRRTRIAMTTTAGFAVVGLALTGCSASGDSEAPALRETSPP